MFNQNATQDKLTRIAIINPDRCKPKRCRQECKKSCPVVRQGERGPNNFLGVFVELVLRNWDVVRGFLYFYKQGL